MQRYIPLLVLFLLTTVLFGSAGAQPAATYRLMLPLIVQPAAAPTQGRPAPDPVRITPVPANDLAVQASIGPAGGQINAIGADGARFQFTIPPGALAEATTITLIPAQLQDLPFAAGGRGAVLIEPSDLLLAAAATLTIQPATPTSVPLSAIGFDPDGSELHLHPTPPPAGPAVTAEAVTLQLQQLRGYGVVGATSGELAAQARRGPSRFADWLTQEVARNGGRKVAISADVIDQYIATEFQPALSDLAQAEQAIRDFVRVDDLIRRHGSDAAFDAWSIHTLTLLNGMNKTVALAHQVCVAQQRPSEGLRIARLIRAFQIFSPQADVSPWRDRLKRCLRFELSFRSTIIEQSDEMTRSVSAEATVLLAAEGTTARLTGAAPAQITATSWEGAQPTCPYSVTRGVSTFAVRDFQLGLRLAPGAAALSYSPGVDLQATYTFRCTTPGGTVEVPVVLPWAAYYDLLNSAKRESTELLHYTIASQGIDIDRFTGWVEQNEENVDGVTFTGDTQFELTHRPQP